jgi:hypothetical protein
MRTSGMLAMSSLLRIIRYLRQSARLLQTASAIGGLLHEWDARVARLKMEKIVCYQRDKRSTSLRRIRYTSHTKPTPLKRQSSSPTVADMFL